MNIISILLIRLWMSWRRSYRVRYRLDCFNTGSRHSVTSSCLLHSVALLLYLILAPFHGHLIPAKAGIQQACGRQVRFVWISVASSLPNLGTRTWCRNEAEMVNVDSYICTDLTLFYLLSIYYENSGYYLMIF